MSSFGGSRQSRDDGAANLGRDLLHGIKVALRRDREAGLEHVHAEQASIWKSRHADLFRVVMLQPGDCSPSRSVVSKIVI
jgi:hypothetical protein